MLTRPLLPSIAAAHRAACLLVLGCALLLSACTPPEEKEAAHLQRGVELYDAGQHDKAMVEFRNVLQLNPKNAQAHYRIGLILESANRLPEAWDAYQTAVTEDPKLVEAQVRVGALALTRGDLDAAGQAAEAIAQSAPDSPDAPAFRAAIALQEGDVEAAIQLAKAALIKAPQHETAIAVLVGAHERLGDTEQAIDLLEEAIAASPDSVPLRLLKIALLGQTGDVAGIAETYREIIVIAPEGGEYRRALAEFHRQRGELAQAEAVLRQAIGDGLLTPDIADLLVKIVDDHRGTVAAAAELNALIAKAPDDRALRFLLADLYVRKEQPAEAEGVLADIAESADSPETAQDALAKLAQLKLTMGDVAGAEKLAQEILSEVGEHRDAHVVLGQIGLLRSQFDDAVRHARTALRQDPQWAPGLLVAAHGHLGKGERDLAIDALHEVVRLAPGNGRAAMLLASLLTQRGDYDTALKVWDHLIRIRYEPARALAARAQIEMAQGNWSAAEANIGWLRELPGQALSTALLAGNLLVARRQYDRAREQFALAQEMAPAAPEPTYGLVRTYLAEGDLDGAIAYLEQRVAQQPEDAVALNQLGGLLARQGKIDAARAAYERAMALRPGVASAHLQLGQMLMGAGRVDDAMAVYQAALEQLPGDIALMNELALTYLMTGATDQAIAAYERLIAKPQAPEGALNNYAALIADHRFTDAEALERARSLMSRFRSSDNPTYLGTLGWLHYRSNDFPVAASFLERAVTLAPNEPLHRYRLGMALYRAGQPQRALQELSQALVPGAEFPGVEEARVTQAHLQQELREGD